MGSKATCRDQSSWSVMSVNPKDPPAISTSFPGCAKLSREMSILRHCKSVRERVKTQRVVAERTCCKNKDNNSQNCMGASPIHAFPTFLRLCNVLEINRTATTEGMGNAAWQRDWKVAQEGLSVDLDCGDRRRFEIGCSFARNGPESLVNRVEEFLPQDQRCVQILWGCIPQSVPPQKEASNEACLQAQIISTGRSAGVRRPAVTLEREGEGALIFHIGVSVRVASFLAQRPSLIHLQKQMTARRPQRMGRGVKYRR
jgi:hypothetical protein